MADRTTTAAPPRCPLAVALAKALVREEDPQTRAWLEALLAGDAAERGLDPTHFDALKGAETSS